MKIQLIDYNEGLCEAWRKEFDGCDDITIHEENYFKVPTECFISPANSFGFLNGGIDNAIRKFYEKEGVDIQKKVQDFIVERFDGELLVGQSIYVSLANYKPTKLPDLIVAPTMRVPMILPKDSINVYLAMKAILNRVKYLQNFTPKLKTVSICGLGTGIGQLPYDVCASQMKWAYRDVWVGHNYDNNYFPVTWGEAQDRHQLITTGKIEGDLQYEKPKD